MLYSFFWVIPRSLNFMCRRFGTLCQFHLQRRYEQLTPPTKMEQNVPKRQHIKFRRREFTQKKEYNIKNFVGYDGRLFLRTRTKCVKWMLVGTPMWPNIRRFQRLHYWTDFDGIC